MIRKASNKGIAVRLPGITLVSMILWVGLVFGFPFEGTSKDRMPTLSPTNPAFSYDSSNRLQSFTAVRTLQSVTPDGHPLGYRPSPIDLSHLKNQAAAAELRLSNGGHSARLGSRAALPESFDLRFQNKVTAVRDQGNCGSCWSFATYGSLESNLMPETDDFSENHLKNTHGFDWDPCDGGNAYISAAYLSRWAGPIDEGYDPYRPDSGGATDVPAPGKHMQNIIILPDRSSSSDNSRIKQAVMSYGGVYTSYYHDSRYYKNDTYSYYYRGWAYSNHAVTIVGWDDTFSRNNFFSTPPGDGAFIIKNSWGLDWGDLGYFYVSYYDSNIGSENFVFAPPESDDNYSRIYQYDPLGWVSSVGFSGTSAWFANVFTAADEEFISAVSFYAASVNSSYTLYVYTGSSSGPMSGTLTVTAKGKFSLPGYYTIPIDPVLVRSGEDFSVVVKLTTPGYRFPIPVEYPENGYSSLARAHAGESFVSANGKDWHDLTSYYSNTNVCLKAFATAAVETVSVPNALSGPNDADPGTTHTFMAGGAWSNLGHPVQYLFDWGDSTNSGWLGNGTMQASKSWSTAHTYIVRVKARCADHPAIESDWAVITDVAVAEKSYTAIEILAPSGGDRIPAGSTYTIQWEAPPEAIRFKVYYSPNNGKSWVSVGDGVSSKFVTWTAPIPSNVQDACLVKVIGYSDAAMTVKVGESESNSTFAIDVVKVTSPGGGVLLAPGDSIGITWATYATASAVNDVRLYYSTNGKTWKLMTTLYQNLGSYRWTVPPLSSNTCKVKVLLRDSSGRSLGYDVSDTSFSIGP